MKHMVLYIHGQGGSAAEASHYQPLFPNCQVLGFDYQVQTPWEAAKEFPAFFDENCAGYDDIMVIANSIGAFFAMHGLAKKEICRAFFISPIVDMEQLILQMMAFDGVTETELADKKEILSSTGQVLSWEYLCYVRTHPVDWPIPTAILYGEKDNMTALDVIHRFAKTRGMRLNIMPEGEHWFHTAQQMEYLDNWMRTLLQSDVM